MEQPRNCNALQLRALQRMDQKHTASMEAQEGVSSSGHSRMESKDAGDDVGRLENDISGADGREMSGSLAAGETHASHLGTTVDKIPTSPAFAPKSKEEEDLMKRFLEWKARKESRHPLYETASRELGRVPLGYSAKPEPPKHPKKSSDFIKQAAVIGPPRSAGLKVGVTRHRYLADLDGQ